MLVIAHERGIYSFQVSTGIEDKVGGSSIMAAVPPAAAMAMVFRSRRILSGNHLFLWRDR
jgi:hypothetical protein